jgi:signal peptidase I
LVGSFAAQPYRPVVFVGNSMAPTYENYAFAMTKPADGKFQRGDIVVVKTKNGPIVKRVAFVGGDVIPQFRTPLGWVDVTRGHPPVAKADRVRYRRVPAGHIYVLGDNYQSSIDSRLLGSLPVDSVERKVVDPRPFHDWEAATPDPPHLVRLRTSGRT